MGETWAYEPRENRWLDLRPAGEIPPGRYGYAMTYDPASGKMLMFGGLDRQGNLLAQGAWTYDPTANRWSEVQQPYGNPDASRFASMLYVTQTDSVMFFSGTRGQEEKLRVFFRDAVTGNWRDLPAGSTSPADLGASPAPGSRSGCGVVEDSALGQVVVFGGLGLYGALDDTWCFDPGASRWVELQSPTAPPARWGAAMAYDPATDQIVLFGGFAASGSEGSAPLDDTWVLYSPRP
jgi:N-acetylneuraminic acid mutarotase